MIYLQCDMRYNKFLLELIDNIPVIEHTVSNCLKFTDNIVSSVYDCEENGDLIEKLSKLGVHVILSKIDNTNQRFLQAMQDEDSDGYVVRVGGDQVLADFDLVQCVLDEMKADEFEWFYDVKVISYLPDIVKISVLKNNYNFLAKRDRYFENLDRLSVKRYRLRYRLMVTNDFRVNNESGYRICKKVIEQKKDIYEVSEKLIDNLQKNEILKKEGMWESWITPYGSFYYDYEKNVNPWLTQSIIFFLRNRISTDLRVFEWGCGNSTLYWSKRVKQVVSIEHNRGWYEIIKNDIPKNVELRYVPLEYDGEYSKQANVSGDEYDIVVIDGRDRVRCAKNAVEALGEKGVIIWDNTERNYYVEGFNFLKEKGFKQIEFRGFTYGITEELNVTSIFYRPGLNVLGI